MAVTRGCGSGAGAGSGVSHNLTLRLGLGLRAGLGLTFVSESIGARRTTPAGRSGTSCNVRAITPPPMLMPIQKIGTPAPTSSRTEACTARRSEQ